MLWGYRRFPPGASGHRGNNAGGASFPAETPGRSCLPLFFGGKNFSSLHFTGIMGSGMSAIAQYLAWSGCAITGSDRLAFADGMKDGREKLERCGCFLFPQDGSDERG